MLVKYSIPEILYPYHSIDKKDMLIMVGQSTQCKERKKTKRKLYDHFPGFKYNIKEGKTFYDKRNIVINFQKYTLQWEQKKSRCLEFQDPT